MLLITAGDCGLGEGVVFPKYKGERLEGTAELPSVLIGMVGVDG